LDVADTGEQGIGQFNNTRRWTVRILNLASCRIAARIRVFTNLAGEPRETTSRGAPVPREWPSFARRTSMSTLHQQMLSRRSFCLCCMGAATLATTGGWLTPSQAYAEAHNIVDLIRDDAANAPIKTHRLRGNISILEGSGGNIGVLTGSDGKVFIDAGITASRPRILEAANGLSHDPIRHLINTHWHFDHADGNQWMNAEGAAI